MGKTWLTRVVKIPLFKIFHFESKDINITKSPDGLFSCNLLARSLFAPSSEEVSKPKAVSRFCTFDKATKVQCLHPCRQIDLKGLKSLALICIGSVWLDSRAISPRLACDDGQRSKF